MIRVAINGFGRIGRNTLKASLGRLANLEFVAVNDLTDTKTLAHLLKHDTSYGAYDKEVTYDERHLIVDGHKILVTAEKDPTKLPWKELAIDVVIESTGRFTDEAGASAHLKAGAKRVIISAPAKGGNVPTYVLGVNGEKYDGKSPVINNASCTTNCIAPVAAVIHEKFGVKKALMTTIHSYTADQVLQDGPHKDLRRGRAAGGRLSLRLYHPGRETDDGGRDQRRHQDRRRDAAIPGHPDLDGGAAGLVGLHPEPVFLDR